MELIRICDRCQRDVDVSDDGWIGGLDFAPRLWRGHTEVVICTGCMTTDEALSALDLFEDEFREMGEPDSIETSDTIAMLRKSLAIQPPHQFGFFELAGYLSERGVPMADL